MTPQHVVALVIDTAMPRGVVGLVVDDVVLSEVFLPDTRRHAEELAGAVERALSHLPNGRAVDHVIAGEGPGSFIGVRVALAYAQGFARARGITGASCSTLFALAHDPALPDGNGEVLIDAKKDAVYALSVSRTDGAAHVTGLARIVEKADLGSIRGSFVVGNSPYEGVAIVPTVNVEGPTISGLYDAWRAASSRPLAPLYLRAPDAKLPSRAPLRTANPHVP